MNGSNSVRVKLLIGSVIVLALVVVCFCKFHSHTGIVSAQTPTALVQKKVEPSTENNLQVPNAVLPAVPKAVKVAATSSVVSGHEMLSPQQIVDELMKIGVNGPITPEQAAKFKAYLDELIQGGPASVVSIKAFLQKNMDLAYRTVSGGDQLGYSSLRASFIDALRQIGGAEAQAAMVETLKTTAAPGELLQLANALNQQAPGQYRDEILAAAQETLKMAANNQLGTNAELGPIIRMVQTYTTPGSMANAAKNNPTEFASAVQLANLPDGQGLPALTKMAEDSGSGSQLMATEMIAQLAGQNSDALNTLAQLVQDGKVQAGDWIHIAPLLAGEQYQADSSGQNFSLVRSDMSPDQISQRILLIDTFMTYVPDGSGPYKALARERSFLAAKAGAN